MRGTRYKENSLFWRCYAALYDKMWDSPLSTSIAMDFAHYSVGAHVVVDLGCGTGLATDKVEGRVVGIDSSSAMIERARCRLNDLRLAHVYGTGLESDYADIVVLANILHLCLYPERVLEEAMRINKQNGLIIVIWPSDDADIDTIARVQKRLGWQGHRVFLFKVSALAIGLMGASLRQTRRSDIEVREAITETCGLDAGIPKQLYWVQNIVLIENK